MKKFLLTAALILAVVTSLTAGTLAAYNQELSITGDINAKDFNFTTDGSDTFNQSIKLAPGDNVWYKVVVANKSEMEAFFNVNAAFEGELAKNGTPVKMIVHDGSMEGAVLGSNFSKGSSNDGIAINGEFTFYVNLVWAYDDSNHDVDNSFENKGATLQISVTGTSVQEGVTNNVGSGAGVSKVVDNAEA